MKSSTFQITVEARVVNSGDFTGETIAKSAVTRTVAGVDLADIGSHTDVDAEISEAFGAVADRLKEEVDAQARLAVVAREAANSAAHGS